MPEASGVVIRGAEIVGISAAVPAATRGVADLADTFGFEEARRISASTGVVTRRIADVGTTTGDLCFSAAERLIAEVAWSKDEIDILIFVSQTPDYVLPATSCVLHGRLGLSQHCAAFDVNLGCSGYVYALWLAGSLVTEARPRALVLVGDTISKLSAAGDRSVVPVFGDGGSATAVRWTGTEAIWHFELGTDGRGAEHLRVPAGGFRNRWSVDAALPHPSPDGNVRSAADLYMNGAEVFAFTMREVRPLIGRTLERVGWSLNDVDAVVLHQANKFMLQHLAKGAGIPLEKLVLNLEDFGNTSSASIPLAIVDSLSHRLASGRLRLLLCGFGVGFSWACAAMELGPIPVPAVVIV